MDQSNWTPDRWPRYFELMDGLLSLLAEFLGVQGELRGLFQYLQNLEVADRENGDPVEKARLVPGTPGLWTAWCGRHGFPSLQVRNIYPINAMEVMLYWKPLVRILRELTPEQCQAIWILKQGDAGSDSQVAVSQSSSVVSVPVEVPAVSQSPSVVSTSVEVSSVSSGEVSQERVEEAMVSAAVETPVSTLADVVASSGAPRGRAVAPPPSVKLNGRRIVRLANDKRGEAIRHCTDLRFPQEAGLTDAHIHMDEAVQDFSRGGDVVKSCLLNNLQGRDRTQGAQKSGKKLLRVKGVVACFMLSRRPVERVSVNYSNMVNNNEVGLCFGAHPGHIRHKGNAALDEVIVDVLKNSFLQGVVAIGEVGLDFCVNKYKSEHEKQERFLKELLTRARAQDRLRNLPLVLHVGEANAKSDEAARKCIAILRSAGYPRDHKIYCHCFTGGIHVANLWLEAFPNVVFGLGPKVVTGDRDVHPEAADVFANLDLKHVLVETDAPRLSLRMGGGMTPWSTFTIVRWLAGARQLIGKSDTFGLCVRDVEATFWRFFFAPEQASASKSN